MSITFASICIRTNDSLLPSPSATFRLHPNLLPDLVRPFERQHALAGAGLHMLRAFLEEPRPCRNALLLKLDAALFSRFGFVLSLQLVVRHRSLGRVEQAMAVVVEPRRDAQLDAVMEVHLRRNNKLVRRCWDQTLSGLVSTDYGLWLLD